jgi:hypothetical protein
MAATGFPGISRGRMKFNMTAKTKVTRNHSSLLRKYFQYPFKAAPPRNDISHKHQTGDSHPVGPDLGLWLQ